MWTIVARSEHSKHTKYNYYKFSSLLCGPIAICMTVTFMCHSFFSSHARSRYLSLYSTSFNLTLWSAGTAKSTIRQVLVFLFTITRSGYLVEIMWPVCISKSLRSLCVSRTDLGLCRYHLFVWSNLNFLHYSLWITLSIQLRLVLFSFCANLLHSLIIWLIVSSLLLLSYTSYFVASYRFLL